MTHTPNIPPELRGVQVSYEMEDHLSHVLGVLTDGIGCRLSSSVIRRPNSSVHGDGLFAIQPVQPETLVAIKQGRILTEEQILDDQLVIGGSHQQIGPNQFLAGVTDQEVDKNKIGYNHSCEPNARIVVPKGFSLAFLVSRRWVETGQEVTADYSVSFDSATQTISNCRCGSEHCRGLIDPTTDWQDPELQKKYAGEFPAWLQLKIDSQLKIKND